VSERDKTQQNFSNKNSRREIKWAGVESLHARQAAKKNGEPQSCDALETASAKRERQGRGVLKKPIPIRDIHLETT